MIMHSGVTMFLGRQTGTDTHIDLFASFSKFVTLKSIAIETFPFTFFKYMSSCGRAIRSFTETKTRLFK